MTPILVKSGWRAVERPGRADYDRAVIENLRPLFAAMRPRPRDDREALASAQIFAMEFGVRHCRMAAVRGDYQRGRAAVHWQLADRLLQLARNAAGDLPDFGQSTLRCWAWDGAELAESEP